MNSLNSYDIDGVILMDKGYCGVYPGPTDIIITGRSFEEENETIRSLEEREIFNTIYFNQVPFSKKTRASSGEHKARVINMLKDLHEVNIEIHFEDDPIQADIIESNCPHVKVVRLVHDLVERENVLRS
jgi:hypothetical protein